MTSKFALGTIAIAASTAFSVALLVGMPETQAASFRTISRIYAYGDSYSDSGASLDISSQSVQANVPDSFVLPNEPALNLYDDQGRWTNGLTSVEVLSQQLDVEFTNYAVGGAKSGNGNFFGWLDSFQNTGVFGQVEQFRIDLAGQAADTEGLYYIFASANDFFEYLSTPDSSGTIDELAAQTVNNIAQSVSDLSALGARQFLVVNSSDLAALPGAPEFEITAESEQFTSEVNALLPAELEKLSQELESVEIALYDHVAISDRIRKSPENYGLKNITDPCQPVFPVEPVCASPNEYYFWDENHPTSRVYQIVGEDMAAFVATQQSKPVPERSTVFSLLMFATGAAFALWVRHIQTISTVKDAA